MKILYRTIFFLFFIFSNNVYADNLMILYRSAVLNFPSLESFKNKEQSLKYDNKALGWQRLFDVDIVANYYRLSTDNYGKYSNGDLGVFTTFDIFNNKGVDRAINRYEIKKNKSLTDAEKKNIFTIITAAYFDLLKNSQLLKIHGETLNWIEKNILLVNAGVEKGIFPATDISRWTIEQLNYQNSVSSDKLEINRALETLRIITAVDSVSAEDIAPAEYEELSEEDILKNSPELSVYDLEKKQVELEIKKECRNLYPYLQVGNSLVMNNEPGSTGDQYFVSANLNFKLFDGGKRYRILSDKSRIKSIENEQKAARALFTEQYRNKLTEMKTMKDMLKNITTAKDLSAENLDKLLTGYQKRFIDFTTLFNAFRDDIAVRENYIKTNIDFNQNYFYLYHLSHGDIYF